MAIQSKHLVCWDKIETPFYIKKWLEEGVTIPFISEPPLCEYENYVLNKEQENFVDSKLSEYIYEGYISEVAEKPRCISPLGCVAKKNKEKWRIISDMRMVNKYINVPKCRYEDLSELPNVIRNNDAYASVDLKDGFNNVVIRKDFRTFFGFKWRNKYFVWNVLNFGCSIAPYLFTKILRPVVSYLRSLNVRCLLYVDDFLLLGPKETLSLDIELVIETLIDLGWKINYEKSCLTPSDTIEYLGLTIKNRDDGVPILTVPGSKIAKVRKDIKRILKHKYVSARVLSKVAGQCNFICKAVLPGRLMLRNVYKLIKLKQNWETKLELTACAIKDLLWWLNSLETWNGKTIIPSKIDGQLVTDASQLGWGGHLGEHITQGFWDQTMSQKHSNIRELMAVLLSLRAFAPHIRNKTISVLSDNITSVAYINHMGGPMEELTDIAKLIWAEAIQNNITIVAKHLSGKLNTQADGLSRAVDKHEWMLSKPLFLYLDSVWGPHSVDRFASLVSTQLPIYNSRFLDPNGMKVDALAQTDWGLENNFVNPPIRLLNKVIEIVQQQEAHATVIAPWWPAQTWFNNLVKLSICPPIRVFRKAIIPLNPAVPEPLRNRKWKIFAWRICGNSKHVFRDGPFRPHRS